MHLGGDFLQNLNNFLSRVLDESWKENEQARASGKKVKTGDITFDKYYKLDEVRITF